MKTKKIRTSPLTLPEHFGAVRPDTNLPTSKSEAGIPWPWILGGGLLIVGVTVLILPKVIPTYVTKEEAQAEAFRNDEQHVQHQRRHNKSMAKVKHEIRKANRRQRALERRIEDLEDDLFENA